MDGKIFIRLLTSMKTNKQPVTSERVRIDRLYTNIHVMIIKFLKEDVMQWNNPSVQCENVLLSLLIKS